MKNPKGGHGAAARLGGPPRCPVRKADALSLALYFLLLGSPHCTLTIPVCKEEEFPVRNECCPKCSPGYRVKEACGEFTGTLCVPCTAGTYTAHLNGLSECLQCRACDPAMGLVTRQKCSSTMNTVCSCDQGHFCVREDGDDCAECRPHSVCRPGQRVQERGTEGQDTVCADCLPGTFSPNGSLTECQLWTNCSNLLLQVEIHPGTSSTDAVCSIWPRWVLLAVILIASLGLCFFFMVTKGRQLCGRCIQMKYFPQRNRQRAEEDAAAVQVLQVSQPLPDVTTEAVEETTSMSLKRDQLADKCLQNAHD